MAFDQLETMALHIDMNMSDLNKSGYIHMDDTTNGTMYIIYHGSGQIPLLTQVFIGFYIFFGILIGLLNTLTIVAIAKSPELRTVTNMFVLSLSCADLLLSPTLIFINFLANIGEILGELGTRVIFTIFLSLMFMSSGTSLLSILAIAADRYFAVLHPYNYRQIVTKIRVKIAIIGIWVYCTIFMFSLVAYYIAQTPAQTFQRLSLLSVILPRPVYLGAVVSQIVICIIASVAIYVRIFFALRARHQKAASLRGKNPNVESAESRRTTTTMALVLGALIISWMPYAILSILGTENIFIKYNWFIMIDTTAILLLYANSFMNPIIYAARSHAFRQAYLRMMCCTCGVATGSPLLSGGAKSAKQGVRSGVDTINAGSRDANGKVKPVDV